jgi:hypothetical protein
MSKMDKHLSHRELKRGEAPKVHFSHCNSGVVTAQLTLSGELDSSVHWNFCTNPLHRTKILKT